MKFRQISLSVVFYSSILTNVSIQATHYDYQSPVPNLTSRGDDQAARTLRELTYAKKFLSELPATINGILWPQRSVSRGQTFARDSESTVVEVTSAITTNTIWQEEHIYHVTADIPVQALLVIEPGTIITFAEGAHLRVNNGGCLVACGTPDKIIRFVPDETIEQYIGAFNAVYIEETASVSTKISYCLIEQAYIGILTSNIRLDTPIRHNYFNFCVYGVTEQGIQLTDIFNNQFYVSYEGALYIDVWSLEEEESSESEIRIQNNTSHYSQYNALTILGATDPVNAGRIEIVNNILRTPITEFIGSILTGFIPRTMAIIIICIIEITPMMSPAVWRCRRTQNHRLKQAQDLSIRCISNRTVRLLTLAAPG